MQNEEILGSILVPCYIYPDRLKKIIVDTGIQILKQNTCRADHKKFNICCHPTDPENCPCPKTFIGLSEKDFFLISCSQIQFFNFLSISLQKCSECAVVNKGATERGMNWIKCHSLL